MPKRKSSVKNKKIVQISNFQYYWEKLISIAESNQSSLSMILGALIILVIGILIFNYFNNPKPDLGPSQQTENTENNLSNKYQVKEGDTLFSIAEKYYQDGLKYQEIANANNLENPDSLEAGQTLDIPKLTSAQETLWGPTITSDTYTVAEGDWLSTIAGRAYGDIFAYSKIAQANNIDNPDLILPGQVLKIPR